MKMKTASLLAFLLLLTSAMAGCDPAWQLRSDWESEVSGNFNLECHNRDHLGYGLHYDIFLNRHQAATREGSGALIRPPVHAGIRHGE